MDLRRKSPFNTYRVVLVGKRGEVGGEGEPGREDDLPLKPHKQPHAAILGLPGIINGPQGMQRSAASYTQRWRDVRQ